jgi:hypothetical protein
MYTGHWRKIAAGRGWCRLATVLAAATLVIAPHQPRPVLAETFAPTGDCLDPSLNPGVHYRSYTVPSGVQTVEVVAIGGAGGAGASFNSNNHGGAGGSGAQVTAILPVSPGQTLRVAVGLNNTIINGDNGGLATPRIPPVTIFDSPAGLNGGGGSASVVTTTDGDPCLRPGASRDAVLVVAAGGGGGGGGETFGSGGNGGSAGANRDFSGQAGSKAYGLDTDCANGGGGGGASATGPGGGGGGGCTGFGGYAPGGGAGSGFQGAAAVPDGGHSLGAGGGGGGGWYGGGAGGVGTVLGGGGGGAGSSYVTPSALSRSISADTSGGPSVTITPYPVTVATLTGTTSGNNWYTSDVRVTLTRSDTGGPGFGFTDYALDRPHCTPVILQCFLEMVPYVSPLTVSSDGFHTLVFYSADRDGRTEIVHTQSFTITHANASVSSSSLGSGTNPTATTGGTAAGAPGSVSATGSGSGQVGVAVYDSNPAGTPVFDSNGAYVDVIVAGSGLNSVTIVDCNLNGGKEVYWYNRATSSWSLVSDQTYNESTHCVTIKVDATTVPRLSQLTGTPIAAGNPPSIAAVAKTADGKPYQKDTWTNQSVTVTFTCSANATPTAPVTLTSDGPNQEATGTCTNGLGEPATTKFAGINVDKTPPSCSIRVSPTVLQPPNSKPVAITGTVTVGDNLSGLASVVSGPVTSNEALASGDVQAFVVNTTYRAPLQLSAVVNIAGKLVAKRSGDGSGRTYSQAITVKDQAGNTNKGLCTWTVAVPHDRAPGR